MPGNELNDAPVLDQVREHWQKIAALLLLKLADGKQVEITVEDIERLREGEFVVFLNGGSRGFTVGLITTQAADVIAAHHAATHVGHA